MVSCLNTINLLFSNVSIRLLILPKRKVGFGGKYCEEKRFSLCIDKIASSLTFMKGQARI